MSVRVHSALSVKWCAFNPDGKLRSALLPGSMSAAGTSRGIRRPPPEYIHPPPPVRPYENNHPADDRPLDFGKGDVQMEERVKRNRDERPDLNSFTTKKSVSAGLFQL